jgi:hypothetical protein
MKALKPGCFGHRGECLGKKVEAKEVNRVSAFDFFKKDVGGVFLGATTFFFAQPTLPPPW